MWEGDFKIKFQTGIISLRKAYRIEEDNYPQNLFSMYLYKVINDFFFPHILQSNSIVFSVLLANHTNNQCPDPFSMQTRLRKRLQEVKSDKFLHAGLFV